MPYIIIYLIAAYFLGWWPFDDTERAIERSDFNVYFYYPGNEREEYLGQVSGLSACQSAANSRAYSLDMQSADWDYICCRVTSSSSCESKHQ